MKTGPSVAIKLNSFVIGSHRSFATILKAEVLTHGYPWPHDF